MGYWYDGEPHNTDTLTLPIDEPGLLYGATVFTTLRVYEQSLTHPLTAWRLHRDRLRASIREFGWVEPDWERLETGTRWMMPQFPVLRVTIFADGHEWITGRPLPPHLDRWQQQGITTWCAPSQWGRSLPHCKTGNYLAPWLARNEAQRHGAQEAILVNSDGNWLETSTGNLWGWKDGTWWTPPLSAGILPGIARSQLISWLKWQNENIAELPWDAHCVKQFETLAYCNSVVEIVPIHTVLTASTAMHYNPEHPCLHQLRKWFMSDRCLDL